MTLVQYAQQEPKYMNGFLKSVLDNLGSNLRKDYDCFIVVTGHERYGKSTLAFQIASYLDPTFNLDRVVFTADQFHEAIEKCDKYQAVVFDEAHGALNSKETMTSLNRKLTQTFTEMGFRNLIIILVLPSFFELGKYAAIHRSNLLLDVYQRGKFAAYDENKKKDIYLRGKRDYKYTKKPNFRGDFSKYNPLDKDEYDNKKLESTSIKVRLSAKELRWIEQRNILIAKLVGMGIKQAEISELIYLNDTEVSRIVRKFSDYTPPEGRIIKIHGLPKLITQQGSERALNAV